MLKLGKKILKNKIVLDLVKKITLVLAISYLIFFAMEAMLPGLVIEAFNFNLLLFLIVGLLTFLVFAEENKQKDGPGAVQKGTWQLITVLLTVLFFLTMFIVLYRVSLGETVIYLIACFGLIVLLKGLFK